MKYWLMACKRTVSWSELSLSGRIQFESTKMPKVLIWRLDEVTVRTSIFYHVYGSTGSPHGVCFVHFVIFAMTINVWTEVHSSAVQHKHIIGPIVLVSIQQQHQRWYRWLEIW